MSKLTPDFKIKVLLWLRNNPEIFVTECWRSGERQKCLLESGSSWVTHSLHQDGLAVDVAFHGETLYPPVGDPRWLRVVESAARHGLDNGYELWGVDRVHFQNDPMTNLSTTDIDIDVLIVNNSKLWNDLNDARLTIDRAQNELHAQNELLRKSKK